MPVALFHGVNSNVGSRRLIAVMILAALTINTAHADDADPQQAKDLGQVTVIANRNSDTYHASDATAGALGTRSVLDTPFSIDAVTADLIQNRQALDINDVFQGRSRRHATGIRLRR
jgi:iron complex outermembrane receptor protein